MFHLTGEQVIYGIVALGAAIELVDCGHAAYINYHAKSLKRSHGHREAQNYVLNYARPLGPLSRYVTRWLREEYSR